MIFDSSMEHAAEAGRRWAEREQHRQAQEGRSQAEIETPERIQMRLDRLAMHARQRQAAMVESHSPGEVANVVETVGLERVLGEPEFRGVAFLDLALAVSRFVGRIVIRSSPTVGRGFGTGFMVSPRLLLTNNHVLPTAQLARFSEVEFDYQYDRFRRLMPSVYFALEPASFFMTDKELDFTLVAVSQSSRDGRKLDPYGWSRLIAAEGKALIGEPLNIIQHPRGQPKQIVFRSNKLIDLFDQFAHYTTDTEPGSSGSPVYNDQWELVALHHSGVPRRDPDGRLMTKDGGLWPLGGDPDDLDWVANEGIRVSSLVRHIEQQALSDAQSQLRKELLESEPPDPREAMAREQTPPPPRRPPVDGKAGEGEDRSQVSFTVPLTITVSLGAAGQEGGATPRIAIAPDPVIPGIPEDPESPTSPSPEERQALAELEEARLRPYYDAAADAEAREAYWAALDPTAFDPAGLFQAVHEILKGTHRPTLPYRPAVHVYPWVDLRPGPQPTVRSIYSNKGFDPRELIEADFRVEAERAEMAARMESLPGRMSTEAALEALEASLPYNCEHVVPQSWFAKKEPMRGDLHHLFTCEMRCNSFRGNTPYFDFPDFEEAVRDDCGKSEHNKFEPGAGKGAVARATLYFLLRYPGFIDRAPGEYDEARLAILLAWHARYPADEYEHHRNAAIQEKQGNRNPLIDFPSWASRIDFTRGLGG
jgi:endonuclease I/V8-like Glu-specific endopeptidase